MKDMDSLVRSFIYAFKGFGWMVAHERNFRIHLTFLSFMAYFLLRYDFFVLTKAESAILILASALVLGGEMINTGIEKADDAFSREKKYSIKVSKDVAAGAVLVFAISAVLIGIVILWQPEAFEALYIYYSTHLVNFAILIVAIILSLIFIFRFDFKKKEQE